MRCPACSGSLTPLVAGAVTVDACSRGCGGVWFDPKELEAVDEPSEDAAAILQVEPVPGSEIEIHRRRACPRCADTYMQQHFSSVLHEVTLDECPGCGGFWLDAGELERFRGEFATEADRRKAGQAALIGPAAQLDDILARDRGYHAAITSCARLFSTRARGRRQGFL